MRNYKIIGVNYADARFKNAQKLNSKTMIKYGLVDEVISYGREDLDEKFLSEYKNIINQKRGGGYWCWKPYIIRNALDKVNEGDYIFYCDSGAVVLEPVSTLIDALEKTGQNVMCFSLIFKEYEYTKRDAFILMDCDSEEFSHTLQRLGGFVVIKKCEETIKLFEEYLLYAKDERIITDLPSTLGKPEYEGFRENRHDQTVWSLLTKKHGYVPFADPSLDIKKRNMYYPDDVLEISTYGKVIDVVRNGKISTMRQYKWFNFRKKYSPWMRFARTPFGRKVKRRLKRISHRLRGIE